MKLRHATAGLVALACVGHAQAQAQAQARTRPKQAAPPDAATLEYLVDWPSSEDDPAADDPLLQLLDVPTADATFPSKASVPITPAEPRPAPRNRP